MKRTLTLSLAGLCAASLLAAGCGGGGSNNRGVLRFSVKWPATSRLIPEASASIKIIVTRASGPGDEGPEELGRALIVRPTTTAFIKDLKALPAHVTATAYPNADGTGTAQATGTVNATIVEDKDTDVPLTMDSTIDHVTVDPSSLNLKPNGSSPVTATAYDAAGSVVLTSVGKWDWKPVDATIATVSASGTSGTVTGLKEGVTTVTATEQESNKSASVLVAVGASAYTITDLGQFNGALDNHGQAINDNGFIVGWSQSFPSPPLQGHQVPFQYGAGFTPLGLINGAKDGHAYGTNSTGDVVGNSSPTIPVNVGAVPTAWLTTGTTILPLLPGSTQGTATAINDAGTIVAVTNGPGTIWVGLQPYDLGALPGGGAANPQAVNVDGVVVGTSVVNSVTSPFAWIPDQPNKPTGTMQALTIPSNASTAQPTSVNSQRKACGFTALNSGLILPALWDITAHTFQTLPTGSRKNGFAYGINDGGVVVGTVFDSTGSPAAVWANGGMAELPTLVPGGEAVAMGINNKGVIVGHARDAQNHFHLVRWDPK